MPWSTSDRRARLPRDWATIRRRVLARDGHRCRALSPDGHRCNQPATDVDHIDDPDDHSDDRLQSLCREHHRGKTVTEAHDAMRRQRALARHPREQHPALRRRRG